MSLAPPAPSIIVLTDTDRNKHGVNASLISQVYIYKYGAPKNAGCFVVSGKKNAFYMETPEVVAQLAGQFINMVGFHTRMQLAKPYTTPVFINVSLISRFVDRPRGGTAIELDAGGFAEVTENIQQVRAMYQAKGGSAQL